jgi:hypothetical protein
MLGRSVVVGVAAGDASGVGVAADVVVAPGVAVIDGVGAGVAVTPGVAVTTGVTVGEGVGALVAVAPGVAPDPTVTIPLVTLTATGEGFTSLTATEDMSIKDMPATFLAVKLILTNVPGFETVQLDLVAPATPVIVPVVLFIVPGRKIVPQPWLSRPPSVTLLA